MLKLYRQIKNRREELNMTQDALAKRVGYKSRTSIHKIVKKISLVNKQKKPSCVREFF